MERRWNSARAACCAPPAFPPTTRCFDLGNDFVAPRPAAEFKRLLCAATRGPAVRPASSRLRREEVARVLAATVDQLVDQRPGRHELDDLLLVYDAEKVVDQARVCSGRGCGPQLCLPGGRKRDR
eukprot:9914559-Alexandrium_andersonii.AAC.1